MEIPVRQPRQPHESESEFRRRRGHEALAFVAKAAPMLAGSDNGVDPSLLDLSLAESVEERLDNATRLARSAAWLGGLREGRESEDR